MSNMAFIIPKVEFSNNSGKVLPNKLLLLDLSYVLDI